MANIRDEAVLKAFGKHLRLLRQMKDMSQEELANQSGIAFSSIGRIERGLINPTICTLVSIAKALEVDKKDLMGFDDAK